MDMHMAATVLPSDDLLQLDHLTPDSLVASLSERLEQQKRFYTKAGTILVAINPYEWRPELYSEAVMAQYRSNAAELPPHLYQTAQMVDSALRGSEAGIQQSIIISGESGAGKTESTKIILSFLVGSMGQEAGPEGDAAPASSLKDRVLRVNPLLEAFGNAKTTRNDNSSRFGKLVELFFRKGPTMEVAGARIVNYLLEKTRLSAPPEGERNFHVLYQIIAPEDAASTASASAARGERPEAMLEALPVGKPEMLAYLRQQSGWTNDEAALEAAAFARTTASLDALGVDLASRGQLWTLLAAVLLLGNLEFEPVKHCDEQRGAENNAENEAENNADSNNEADGRADGAGGSQPSDPKLTPAIAKLLGVSPAALAAALCKRKLAIRNQSLIHKQQSPEQAKETRDALGRALYNGIFEWLVQRANATIAPKDEEGAAAAGEGGLRQPLSSVGVLDIYGFESLESNSFEQLLINFANEKLQRVRRTRATTHPSPDPSTHPSPDPSTHASEHARFRARTLPSTHRATHHHATVSSPYPATPLLSAPFSCSTCTSSSSSRPSTKRRASSGRPSSGGTMRPPSSSSRAVPRGCPAYSSHWMTPPGGRPRTPTPTSTCSTSSTRPLREGRAAGSRARPAAAEEAEEEGTPREEATPRTPAPSWAHAPSSRSGTTRAT